MYFSPQTCDRRSQLRFRLKSILVNKYSNNHHHSSCSARGMTVQLGARLQQATPASSSRTLSTRKVRETHLSREDTSLQFDDILLYNQGLTSWDFAPEKHDTAKVSRRSQQHNAGKQISGGRIVEQTATRLQGLNERHRCQVKRPVGRPQFFDARPQLVLLREQKTTFLWTERHKFYKRTLEHCLCLCL